MVNNNRDGLPPSDILKKETTKDTKDDVIKTIRESRKSKETAEIENKKLEKKLTPEEKKILRLEKELENLQQGIIKERAERTEDSPKAKKLKEQISREKELLGLVEGKELETAEIETIKYNNTRIKQFESLINKAKEKLKTGNFKTPQSKVYEQSKELIEKITEYEKLKDDVIFEIEKEKLKTGLRPSRQSAKLLYLKLAPSQKWSGIIANRRMKAF